MAADEGLGAHRGAGLDQGVVTASISALRHRDQQRGAVEGAVRHRDHFGQRIERARPPALQPATRTLQISTSVTMRVGVGRAMHEHRQAGRMVGALDERQPRDDLGRVVAFERGPPRARPAPRRPARGRDRPRGRNRRDHAGGAHVGHERHREAEMEARGIAHRASPAERSACTENGACTKVKVAMMTRQMLSTVSSGRMPLWRSTSRRIMSASRAGPERRAGFLRLLDRDQRVDDVAALHQQAVHRLVDAVDLAAQVGERWVGGTVSAWPWESDSYGAVLLMARRSAPTPPKSKKTLT